MDRSTTNLEQLATAYARADQDTTDIIDSLTEDELRQLNQALGGLRNTIKLELSRR